jgi:hypothetical protein
MPETQSPEETETVTEEETPTPAQVAKKAQPKPAEPQADSTELPADHPLVKALEAQKATIKELKSKASRLDEIEEAQKSELQKAIERAEAAEGTLATLQAAQQISDWKSEVTKLPKYAGVSPDVLRGTTLEEIEEHAAQLKALLPEPRKPGHVPGEGRTVTNGTGDPAQQFADLIRNARK